MIAWDEELGVRGLLELCGADTALHVPLQPPDSASESLNVRIAISPDESPLKTDTFTGLRLPWCCVVSFFVSILGPGHDERQE